MDFLPTTIQDKMKCFMNYFNYDKALFYRTTREQKCSLFYCKKKEKKNAERRRNLEIH